MTHVAVLPGDGIGPEVAAEAIRVLDALGIGHSEHAFGGNAILDQGTPLPDETLAACRAADAVLLAAVGLPELEGQPVRPEQGLLGLRKELGVYANLRPAVGNGVDMMIVRELVGGLYFGAKGVRDDGTWFDTCEYTRPEVERIARRAFEIARGRGGRLTSVDKVNVMHTSRLWRDVVTELGAADYPDVALDHALVDSFAMTIVQAPADDRHRRHGEHVRRHPLGRRCRGDRRARACRLSIARRQRPGPLRARARIGPPDRRAGDSQPGRDAPLARAAARPRPREARRGNGTRQGGRRGARADPHPRPRRHRDDIDVRHGRLARARDCTYPVTTMQSALPLTVFSGFALFGFAFTG